MPMSKTLRHERDIKTKKYLETYCFSTEADVGAGAQSGTGLCFSTQKKILDRCPNPFSKQTPKLLEQRNHAGEQNLNTSGSAT